MPYVWMDDTFTQDELNTIMQDFGKLGTEDARVHNSAGHLIRVPEVRSSQIKMHFVNEDNAWIFERIKASIEEANEHIYDFDLTGFDSIQYAEYRDTGDKYDFHSDIWYRNAPINAFLHRKLSFILPLNSDYEGCDLEFMIESGKPEIAEQTPGKLLIFPSWLLHRITPLVSGTRKSLAGWVAGPKFR